MDNNIAISLFWIDKNDIALLPKKQCDVIVNCMTPIGLRSEHREFMPAEYNEHGELLEPHYFATDRSRFVWDDRFTHFMVYPEPI